LSTSTRVLSMANGAVKVTFGADSRSPVTLIAFSESETGTVGVGVADGDGVAEVVAEAEADGVAGTGVGVDAGAPQAVTLSRATAAGIRRRSCTRRG